MKTILLLIKCVALALVVLMTDVSKGQVASFKDGLKVGAKGQPDSKAILDVVSTTKGFLPPRMTEAQRNAISSPPAGLLIFNTDTATLNQYDGSAWGAVAGAASGAQYNVLTNFGFEDSDFDADWTASGGTLAAATGTNILFGDQSATWDSNGAGQTFSYSAITIGEGFKANNCEGAIYVKTPSGTSTHTLQVHDGTNAIASATVISRANAVEISTGPFPCPTSGTWTLRLVSVNADEPLIAVDDAYLGIARNVGTVRQATHKGSIRMTGCTDWSRSSTSFGDFTATAGCSYTVTGDVLSPSTFIPGFRLQNVAPGRYLILARGLFGKSVTTTNADLSFRFSDGTNTFSEQISSAVASSSGQSFGTGQISGAITYSTAQSTLTIQVQGKVSSTASSTAAFISDDQAATAGQINGLEFDVYYFPTDAQTAIYPNAQGLSWSGTHANDCGWTTTSASLAAIGTGDASCTFTTLSNRNFGTVTSATASSNNIPGIVFTPTLSGKYFICATAHAYNASAVGNFAGLAIHDGTSIIASASRRNGNASSGTNDEIPFTLCGIATLASGASRTVQLYANASAGTTTLSAGASGVANVTWNILNIDQPVQALIANSMSTSTRGGRETEFVTVACSSSSSKTDEDSILSAVGNISSGTCSFTMTSGLFSTAPRCFVTLINGAVSDTKVNCQTTSATAGTVSCYGNGANCTSFSVNMMLNAPR